MLPPEPDPKSSRSWFVRILRLLIILAASGAILLVLFGSPWVAQVFAPHTTLQHSEALAQQASPTPTPFQPTTTVAPLASPTATYSALQPFEAGGAASLDGLMALSLPENGYSQLFSHQLLGQPFTRLTSGAWDDIQPEISPDGQRIAFASDRGGAWDLYILDLFSGSTVQLTHDAAFDGHPSWSPDGAWLTYEHMDDGNLEIYIQPIDGSVDPVKISAGNGADYEPAWRPNARQIAFVSNRDGSQQIWLVDLEAEGDERFQQLIQSPGTQNSPAWSPDGAWLAWSQLKNGVSMIFAQNIGDSGSAPRRIGFGENPHWSITGSAILAELQGANEVYLTAYTLSGGLALAPDLMPGNLEGITWGVGSLPDPLPAALSAAAQATITSPASASLGNATVDLADVNAPDPEINKAALPAFEALRQRAAQLLGWDALAELSNAYLALDQPLSPGRQQDWLYTGRAFELHSGLLDAAWMAIVREDIEGETYWRVYLKASGDLGRPLTDLPWDIKARYSSIESEYQAGGRLMESLPAGGWLDFTALAAEFGFERVPALSNWRSYYQGALFNLFVFRQGLTWEDAMLQLYSPEELATLQP